MQTVLEDRIVERWDRAFQRGELLYIETEVAHIKEKEIEFQIRVAPSLAKKPTGKLGVKDEEQQKSKANPFLPYSQELFVQEHGKYNILLNKFCVVPHHIVIATKEFEKQTDPLNPEDLECIWFCIMQIKSRPVLAFFNCGELSGGSQPHKHMQVIPLPSDVRFTPPINSCIYGSQEFKKPGEIFDIPELPYVHYISLLDPQQLSLGHGRHEEVSHYLNDVFHSLLDAMIESLHKQSSLISLNSLSYNVVMTSTWLMIVPRSKEKYENMSVNSLGYAGMLLTKSKEELELVKDAGVLNILESLAFSKQNVIMDESN
ncbi:ATP adenylyltransferase [Gigaspora margarita]|uniref:ATP adenylyltransferase n=1 Tax=Gigaspora margarita TaxID=4874 RepID=A0A8H4A4E4_GIGMA|nr:ATP adenylyltransferase [Gigaspora margarita]